MITLQCKPNHSSDLQAIHYTQRSSNISGPVNCTPAEQRCQLNDTAT